MSQQLREDFFRFASKQYLCLDYDPFHPVLRCLERDMDQDQSLWLSFLYISFYNMGSAWAAFELTGREPNELPDEAAQLPVGQQHRNLRGERRIKKCIRSYLEECDKVGGQWEFYTQEFSGDQCEDWPKLKENVRRVWGNGRWASYTGAELFQKVNGIPTYPCDLGNDGSTGPRRGLEFLFHELDVDGKEAVGILDEWGDRLFQTAKERFREEVRHIPYVSHYDYAMLESALCDFQSLVRGRYYVGRDIDRMQQRAVKAEKRLGRSLPRIWEARDEVFHDDFLGEKQGWDGIISPRLEKYQEEGEIVHHWEGHPRPPYKP